MGCWWGKGWLGTSRGAFGVMKQVGHVLEKIRDGVRGEKNKADFWGVGGEVLASAETHWEGLERVGSLLVLGSEGGGDRCWRGFWGGGGGAGKAGITQAHPAQSRGVCWNDSLSNYFFKILLKK